MQSRMSTAQLGSDQWTTHSQHQTQLDTLTIVQKQIKNKKVKTPKVKGVKNSKRQTTKHSKN